MFLSSFYFSFLMTFFDIDNIAKRIESFILSTCRINHRYYLHLLSLSLFFFLIIHFELVRFYLNVYTINRRLKRAHSKHQSFFVNRIGVHQMYAYLTDFCSLVFLSRGITFIYVRLFIKNKGSITRSIFGLNIMPTNMLVCFSFLFLYIYTCKWHIP